MKTILTGIRINSEITLGNFLGALLPMVRLANKYSETHHVNIFIPDLHSIISSIDGDLKQNTIRELKYYLAAGLKINSNIHIYRQSYIPAHSELCWILDCYTSMGEALRMTQYKEKSQNNDSSTNVGIFNYPILMAADILLYDANFIPVGEDQFQHLELTRNIAERFNRKYGEIFTIPEKTADNSKIMMSDTPAQAAKKIMSATTDSLANINFDFQNQPGISNLLQIEALLSDQPLSTVIKKWSNQNRYGDFKKQVASTVSNFLSDFQTKADTISDQTILDLLAEGETYATQKANQTLLKVQKSIGLR